MLAIPLYLRQQGQAPVSCIARCAPRPYASPKHLSKALLASSSGWCGELGRASPKVWGRVGTSGSPKLTPETWEKEGGKQPGVPQKGWEPARISVLGLGAQRGHL